MLCPFFLVRLMLTEMTKHWQKQKLLQLKENPFKELDAV